MIKIESREDYDKAMSVVLELMDAMDGIRKAHKGSEAILVALTEAISAYEKEYEMDQAKE